VPLDRGLRWKLFCAEVHGLFLAGLGICVPILPGRLVVGSRHPPQIATLIALPSEFQGCRSCLVTSARSVVFNFRPVSSQLFSELSRNLQRFPTLKAGTSCCHALPSRVFECIPNTVAASCRSRRGSKAGVMVRGFAFAAESIQPHFEEPQGGAEITYVLPRCPKVPLQVQFTGRGYLSMTLISTHRPTFSIARSPKKCNPTVGRDCAPIPRPRVADMAHPHRNVFSSLTF
jgi:hypothetical protein